MNQSFKQVFVTNSGTLLSSGTTTDLAINQIGIFDADTYQATTTPTYFKNKGIRIGWGYPDLPQAALMDGTFNWNELSEKIGGKKIKRVRTARAVHGHNEIVTIGFSGSVSDTDTLSIKPGQKKYYYLRLTGAPIDRIYGTNGFIRRYAVEGPCIDDCSDDCTAVSDNAAVAKSLADQITYDLKFKGLVKASVILSPLSTSGTINDYEFVVTLSDDGSNEALGYVQSQYPGVKVTRKSRVGVLSTYVVHSSTNSAPADVTNAGLTIIPDCPTCPSGYTLVASGLVYEVKRADAGSSGNLTTVKTDYGIVSPETGVRLSYQNGVSTYILVSATALTVSGVDQLKSLGATTNSCVITSATTTAWASGATFLKFPKSYTITLADDVCGNNRLTALQAAYPTLTVALVSGSGTCAHTYSTTVYSQAVDATCSVESLVFTAPDAFEGTPWTEVVVPFDGSTVLAGVKLESAWVDRVTNTCTYGYYPYEADGVHIEISEYDYNYNAEPEKCKINSSVVKLIQGIQYPKGVGSYVRKEEEKSKELFLKYYTYDPIGREVSGFSFAADPHKFYDEISIEFDYNYPVGSFSTEYKDAYTLNIYVQEGLGANLVAAINSYITSPEIGLDPVNY